jgi:hypothetical protein
VVAETDDAFDFVLGVATESRDLDSIASWIEARLVPHSL